MPTETESRQHTCCFTGHRPEKVGYAEDIVIEKLDDAISSAIKDGYDTFITGMARGVDIGAAELVLKYRDNGALANLICACPFDGFETSWKKEWQDRYNAILQKANQVSYISESYSKSCFQERNKWMVDRSNLVIAVYNGESGGTRNTIKYAEKHGIKINNVLDL